MLRNQKQCHHKRTQTLLKAFSHISSDRILIFQHCWTRLPHSPFHQIPYQIAHQHNAKIQLAIEKVAHRTDQLTCKVHLSGALGSSTTHAYPLQQDVLNLQQRVTEIQGGQTQSLCSDQPSGGRGGRACEARRTV